MGFPRHLGGSLCWFSGHVLWIHATAQRTHAAKKGCVCVLALPESKVVSRFAVSLKSALCQTQRSHLIAGPENVGENVAGTCP